MARVAGSQSLSMALDGQPDLQAAIERITKESKDLRPAWDQFYRPHFHNAMEQTFETRAGGRWRPLKGRYAAWKSRHGGGELMVLTGALRASLAGDTGESIYRPEPRQMDIGSTNIPTNTPRGRMVIYAHSTAMAYHLGQAAQEHADYYGIKWRK